MLYLKFAKEVAPKCAHHKKERKEGRGEEEGWEGKEEKEEKKRKGEERKR